MDRLPSNHELNRRHNKYHTIIATFLFFMALQPLVGWDYFILETSRVGLLWKGDRPDTETSS